MLKAEGLSKYFHHHAILKDISFKIPMGAIAALLGPSGSGKSTLLRCISRLEAPHSGSLTFQGQPLSALPSHGIGMVFQGFHLFPHMTVLQNIVHAPAQLRQMARKEAEGKAKDLLEQFGLDDKGNHFPGQLSGGQKQRVAIARALIVDPPILLFDEPTSALDPEMVSDIASLIESLKSPNRIVMMATHELRVAKLAADQVLFLDHGALVEDATKDDFFENPQSVRAQQFLRNLTIS